MTKMLTPGLVAGFLAAGAIAAGAAGKPALAAFLSDPETAGQLLTAIHASLKTTGCRDAGDMPPN